MIMWRTHNPAGRAEVVDALLTSARKLVAERGPGVVLRDIADDAGVTFGLVHHYLGTKDQLVEVVYRAAAEAMAVRLAEAKDLDEALDLLMRSGDGTTARLIGWAALEGRAAEPAFRALACSGGNRRIGQRDARVAGLALADEDARLFAALAMTIALGWRLFGTTALLAAGLKGPTDRQGKQIEELVRRLAIETTAR